LFTILQITLGQAPDVAMTDSINLSNEALNASRNEIQKLYGKEYLPEKPISY
jgi:DNA topoisomerase IA